MRVVRQSSAGGFGRISAEEAAQYWSVLAVHSHIHISQGKVATSHLLLLI